MLKKIIVFIVSLLIVECFDQPSFNTPNLSRNSTWNSVAITYPYQDTTLYHPRSLFVDRNDSIYVSFTTKGIAVVWYRNNECLPKIYSADDATTSFSNLLNFLGQIFSLFSDMVANIVNFWFPSSVKDNYFNVANSLFVAFDGDIYVGNQDQTSIDRWSKTSSMTNIDTDEKQCFGIFINLRNELYCSLRNQNQVMKKSMNEPTSSWTIVTENSWSWQGLLYLPTPPELNKPHGIFVDFNFDLYIANSDNNEIQRLENNSSRREVLINSSVKFDDKELSYPTSVILDGNKNLYIVDAMNHRIVFASADGKTFRCLVACSDKGSEAHQLSYPMSISFDSSGNILVSDTQNHRVQKFFLIDSQSSSTVSAGENIFNQTNCDKILNTTSVKPPTTRQISTETMINSSLTTLVETKMTSDSTTLSQQDLTVLNKTQHQQFIPSNCTSKDVIGSFCNISNDPCQVLNHPCGQLGICTRDFNRSLGYSCSCHSNSSDSNCQERKKPCQHDTCLNGGLCILLNNSDFLCNCTENHSGVRCEQKIINHCRNVTCLNRGICYPTATSYKCRCLSNDYTGRHCEKAPTSIIIRQYISKGFGYAGILAIATVMIFVIVMDVLKYVFGIDPVESERQLMRQEKALRERQKKTVVIYHAKYRP